jgi:hypothetical protein
MNPWWLTVIVPASILLGGVGLIALAWFTRDVFPTLFVPSDWD